MRTSAELAAVFALAEEGVTDSEIARRMQIPRTTIRDWRAGRYQRRSRTEPPFDPRTFPAAPYAYLLGLYLGDGSISDVARTARLRITLDSAYPQVVEECRSAIAAVMPDRRVNVAPRKLSRCVDVGCYSKLWPTLFPQHAPGPKHLRSITLEPWQRDLVVRCPREFIRGLYHSDGCYVTNRINSGNGTTYAYDRYFFSNESAEIRQLFSWACALVGVSSRQSNRKTISVARREAVAMLNGFLGAKR